MSIVMMESPNDVPKLKFFEVTSEESFEESLMAGGYGRYKTKEWTRQPQFQPKPLLLRVKPSSTPSYNTPKPSTPTRSTLENQLLSSIIQTKNPPPTEKHFRRHHRLSVFKSTESTESYPLTSIPVKRPKLFVLELEDKGRVLSDTTDPSRTPKTKRRKPGTAPSPKEKRETVHVASTSSAAPAVEIYSDYPNWPDDEFPWRMREEEREEILKEEREQEIGLIEKFFDWDTDGEDAPEEEEHTRRTRIWTRHGPFLPGQADAHRALLAKMKSMRALEVLSSQFISCRQRKKPTNEECLCGGRVDGRVLLCNRCQAWYHPQCIGVTESIDELARDPWYCDDCVVEIDESEISPPEGNQVAVESLDKISSDLRSSEASSSTLSEMRAVFSWNMCKLR